jgi:hypothetical protein
MSGMSARFRMRRFRPSGCGLSERLYSLSIIMLLSSIYQIILTGF